VLELLLYHKDIQACGLKTRCKVLRSKLDDRLTEEKGHLVTAQDVIRKMYRCIDDTSGPLTSGHASLMKIAAEKKELKRRLAKYEGQQVEPEADSVVPDVETFREVVRKLSPLDNQVLYWWANDAINGCNYLDERKKNTRAYSVLVFSVRSLATPFNTIISSHPLTRSNLVSRQHQHD
uniref:Uncharacterized protein n=1 Tax=Glossina palpalis gambiensis TaxID=67801 RepID=A0A1B0B0V0_9MUSC